MNRRKFFTLAGLAGLGIAPNLVDAKEEDDDKIWIPKKAVQREICDNPQVDMSEKKWIAEITSDGHGVPTFQLTFGRQQFNWWAYKLKVHYKHLPDSYDVNIWKIGALFTRDLCVEDINYYSQIPEEFRGFVKKVVKHFTPWMKKCEQENNNITCMTDDLSKAMKEIKL